MRKEPPLWMKISFILLLVALSIFVRLGSDHQTDFDSYWLHGMAESIQSEEASLWVFHPASLFGFYPLSYPSGTPFFLAMFSEITGLDMLNTIMLSSILIGLIIIGFVFLVSYELFSSWFIAFLSALTVSLSPTLINYTSFNAGGRVFIMPFMLLFFWSLIMWHKKKEWKYSIIALSSFIFSLLAHRTGMFLFPILFAFILAKIYFHLPYMWTYVREHKHYKKHIHPRYEKNKYYLLFDAGIIIAFLIGIKLIDLLIRGRLVYNLERVVLSKVDSFVHSGHFFLSFFTILGIILIGLFFLLFLKYYHKKKPIKSFLHFLHTHYHNIFVSPQTYFTHLILIIFFVLFIGQFFGKSFYSPSLHEYQIGFINGASPAHIFVNFFVNYTSAVTFIFIFLIIGFVKLIYTKEKTFGEWTFIFFILFFSGLLLDKRYTRIFLIPIISILASYGVYHTYLFLLKKKKKIWVIGSHVFISIIILAIIIGAQSPFIRAQYKEVHTSFDDVSPYWQTGQYIRGIDGKFSTVTTEELVAGVIIFASSGVPGASHNIYYFVDEKYLEPTPLTYEKIKDNIRNGEKIQSFWYLSDWIIPGQYYIGRHARYTFQHEFTNKISQRIISDYNERFYIHDEALEENRFLESIIPVKNIVYKTPETTVYDIEEGRQ